MRIKWRYANNPYWRLLSCKPRKGLSLASEHLASLEAEKADADIARILPRTQQAVGAYSESYALISAGKGTHIGETSRFKNLLDTLPEKFRRIDLKIQLEYLEKTPDYIALFPHGKSAIYYGTYEQIINEVKALSDRLGSYTNLAGAKADVDAIYTELLTIRSGQQQAGQTTATAYDIFELKAQELAVVMFANLGALIEKFAATPENIERFFNLNLLRTSGAAKNGNTGSEGMISGIISNSQAKGLQGVTVALTGKSGNVTTTSDEDGEFVFDGLAGGTYSLMATMTDFKPVLRENLTLETDDELTVDFMMESV